MDRKQFESLPLGSVVTHRATDRMCSYRKVADGTGWAICNPTAPWAGQYPGRPGSAVLPADAAGDVTLVLLGTGPKAPSKKDLRIAELEESLEARGNQLADARKAEGELRSTIIELRRALASAKAEIERLTVKPNLWRDGDVAWNKGYESGDPNGVRWAIGGRWTDARGLVVHYSSLDGPGDVGEEYELLYRFGG